MACSLLQVDFLPFDLFVEHYLHSSQLVGNVATVSCHRFDLLVDVAAQVQVTVVAATTLLIYDPVVGHFVCQAIPATLSVGRGMDTGETIRKLCLTRVVLVNCFEDSAFYTKLLIRILDLDRNFMGGIIDSLFFSRKFTNTVSHKGLF